ncbi:MAG TPA: response regulator transcription factor [Burkholderiaceae bacterium]|nr:response regulator transcription factor [Burkholderiaceae bacterium]
MIRVEAPLFLFVARDGAPLAPLRQALTVHGAESLLVDQLEHARKLLVARDIDAVLLDVEGFGKSYIVMLCELVAAARTPVILLGAECEEIDQIIGIELGAADFLPRTATPRLVLAKLNRLIAARSAAAEAMLVTIGPLQLDRASRGVRVGDVLLMLTSREFDLLFLLAQSHGLPLDRSTIARRLHGRDTDDGRGIDIAVSRIRRKFAVAGIAAARICTLYGRGYMLQVDIARPGAGGVNVGAGPARPRLVPAEPLAVHMGHA